MDESQVVVSFRECKGMPRNKKALPLTWQRFRAKISSTTTHGQAALPGQSK